MIFSEILTSEQTGTNLKEKERVPWSQLNKLRKQLLEENSSKLKTFSGAMKSEALECIVKKL